MAAKFVRRLRKEFGPRGCNLPRSLQFLREVPFHAITEETVSTRRHVRVELRPSVVAAFQARDESLVAQLEVVKYKVLELQAELSASAAQL